jgi:hypothetical protein
VAISPPGLNHIRAATSARPASPARAQATIVEDLVPARDEEQERTVGLLLLGKGAVVAHVFGRPLAVEMDDDQQS